MKHRIDARDMPVDMAERGPWFKQQGAEHRIRLGESFILAQEPVTEPCPCLSRVRIGGKPVNASTSTTVVAGNPQCPNCEGYQTQRKGGPILAFFKALIIASCLFWVGFVFPPAMFLAAIVLFLSPFAAMAFVGGGSQQVCKTCAHTWKLGQ